MSENRQVAADGLLRQVKPEDLEQFGLIPEIIGRLPVIAPLDALGVDDLARILHTPKRFVDSAVQEAGPVPRCGLDVHRCGDQGDRQDRPGAWDGSPRASRSVVEEVLEGVLFEVEAGVRYVITDKTVRGGEPVKQSMTQPRAPLSVHLLRRFRARESS